MLTAGITKMAHLQIALQQQHPPAFTAFLQSVLVTITPTLASCCCSSPDSSYLAAGFSASGSQLIQITQTDRKHSLSSHNQLQESHAQAASTTSPAHVISWDPSRPWRDPTQQPAESAAALCSQGQLWGPSHLSLRVCGWGQ